VGGVGISAEGNKRKDIGVLLLHGFAGDPAEISPLRDYLTRKGYYVECPLLPGHGLDKKALSQTTHEDWIGAAQQAFLALSERYGRVVVIGFSMGGLLAVNLWNYGFSGMVAVNMPIYYWNFKNILRNLFTDPGQYCRKYFQASTDKPLSSMVEFQKLLAKTKPMLGNITCKTMVIQAADDDTVHHKSADYILKKIRAVKTVYRPARGGHMIFHSEIGDEVCRRIESFIATC